MKTNKMIILVIVTIALLSVNTLANDLSVTHTITQQQVKPGDSSIITLTLSAIGGTVENIKIRPVQEGYFTIKPNEIDVDTLSLSKVIAESFVVDISNKASSGDYTISFEIEYYDGSSTKYMTLTIPITVIGEPIIHVKNYTIDKQTIHSGEDFISQITLINVGDGIAKNIFITFNSSLIVPKTSTIYIEELQKNEEKTVKVHFSVQPNAQPGSYPIPVMISYVNKDGSMTYTKQYLMTVEITEKGGIETYIENVLQTSQNEKKVRIKFVNSADSQLKFIKVTLPSYANPQSIYIGNLDSDDYSTEDVYIPLNVSSIKLNVTYTTPLNDIVTNQIELQLPKPEISPINQKESSAATGKILLVFVGLVLGYFIGRVRRKK
ncbi:MAG: hypothetical protein J7K83_01325 [Candidatus Aenigmarchaeota archaeon]|nr:hypothetical protein [Candidatus Aenigmarchaeota archaeon]